MTLGLVGGEGKPDFWHSLNVVGPHMNDVTLLEMKGKKMMLSLI